MAPPNEDTVVSRTKKRVAPLGLILAALALAILAQRPATAQANSPILTRGPYLQSVTEHSIIICWETDAAGNGAVEYGLTASYGSTVSETVPATRHAITLTDLSPYTMYHYRVLTDSLPLSSDNTFTTAASLTQTTFSFVAFGDTRTNATDHQSVVDRLVATGPDFYVHSGDLVEDGRLMTEWDTFFDVEKALMPVSPLFPSLGNHEREDANYFDLFYLPNNERWYAFDYGNAHFVALQVDNYGDYSVGSAQYTWLETDLANTDRPWKFVFFHVPPYSSGWHGSFDADIANIRATLPPLFEQYGVNVVFNGHDHDYERSVVNGVTYIVTGGGGAPLRPQVSTNSWTQYFTSTLHFVKISINGNSLSGVSIKPDGSQFDPFTLEILLTPTATPTVPPTATATPTDTPTATATPTATLQPSMYLPMILKSWP